MSAKLFFSQVTERNVAGNFYGLLWNEDGLVRDFSDNTFKAYVTLDIDNYDFGAGAATAGGHFTLTIPGTVPAGRYNVELWQRAGATPVEADDTFTRDIFIQWDGADLIEMNTLGSEVAAIVAALPANFGLLSIDGTGGVSVVGLDGAAAAALWATLDSDPVFSGVPNTIGKHIKSMLDATVASRASASSITGLPASVWDLADGIELGETPRQTLRLLRAVLAGLTAISGPVGLISTVVFKRKDGTTALTVEYNATGARSSAVEGPLT